MEEREELKRLQKLSLFGAHVVLFVIFVLAAAAAALVISLFLPDLIEEIFRCGTEEAYFAAASLIISALLLIILLHSAYILLKCISKERTPFTVNNVSSLKRMVVILIIIGVVENVFNLGTGYLSSSNGFSISVSYFIAAFLVYIVTLIFQYGTALQEESDLTV